ncbi:MAG: hypothetical protein HKN21_11225 [Candidatus Eisenbacteria bacterium]|uniref:TssC1 N-terminal domain-containing protein n=1 Tax=Eiseniibacteriota bacterium TaxID=2212470 RepID=A0A7Y2EAJ7_UNCEI|nr:hypothetical protein [Candidatus Eisenbacteria bacterium]
MPGRMEFETTFRTQSQYKSVGRPDPETPFRVVMIGDFSGRGNQGRMGAALASLPAPSIDLDNFDQRMGAYAPELSLTLPDGSGSMTVKFGEIDDFSPDALYDRLELFQKLRDLRSRLLDSSTFAAAAAELKGSPASPTPGETPPSSNNPEEASESEGDMLERLLGKQPTSTPEAREQSKKADISSFIQSIVGDVSVPDNTQEQTVLVEQVDRTIANQMRWLLHHPAFQRLESHWRAAEEFVRRVSLDETLTLQLFDVSYEEMLADFTLPENESGLRRVLGDQKAGKDHPVSLLVCLHTIRNEPLELVALAAAGRMAGESGAVWLMGADPSFLGVPSIQDWSQKETGVKQEVAWSALRKMSEANHIAMAAPRILLRLPYGTDSDPIDRFVFEEMESADGDAYLWGSGAVALATLLAESFSEREWDMQAGNHQDLGDLPTHIKRRDGESSLQAVAEAYLSEKQGQKLMELGLCPLLSYRDRGAVRVLQFRSIADPAAGLAGLWT